MTSGAEGEYELQPMPAEQEEDAFEEPENAYEEPPDGLQRDEWAEQGGDAHDQTADGGMLAASGELDTSNVVQPSNNATNDTNDAYRGDREREEQQPPAENEGGGDKSKKAKDQSKAEKREEERRRKQENEDRSLQEREAEKDRKREEKRRRKEDKESRRRSGGGSPSFSCNTYVTRLAQEIGFSLWFRVYVFYLLLCNLTFVVLLGYNYMLASGFRMMVQHNDSSPFLVQVAMLAFFWFTAMLTTTFIYLNVRLVVSWLGMSRKSCNLFFLPNRYEDEQKALFFRDYQLLLFEILVLVVPIAYAVVVTIQNEESIVGFIGHFSFVGFVIFQILVLLIWSYFWVRSVMEKNKAWRRGSRLLKDAKELDHIETRRSRRRYDDDTDDTESDDDDRHRRRRNRKKRSSGSDESDQDRNRRRTASKVSRKKSDDTDNDENQRTTRRGRNQPEAVRWHRRRRANPLVMAEFGLDILSTQAYVLHAIVGIVWVLVLMYPAGSSISSFEWVVIIMVTIIAGLLLLTQKVSKKSAKKVANRQRRASYIVVVFVVFMLFAVVAAAATVSSVAPVLFVMMLMTQFMMVRRHDLHVRDDGEGRVFLPYTNDEKTERRRRLRLGNAPMFIPLIPCGSIWQTCCTEGCCMEPNQVDKGANSSAVLNSTLQATVRKQRSERLSGANATLGQADANVAMCDRDGRYDLVVRPAENPGYMLKGQTSEFVTTDTGKRKLAREVYLNTRERVLQADLMVMTWYMLVFIGLMGIVYGYGDWTLPEISSIGAQVSPTGRYEGTNPYRVCDLAWGEDGSVSLQDLALMTFISATDNDDDKTASVAAWFPDDLLAWNIRDSAAGNSTFQEANGVPVGWDQYDGYYSPKAPGTRYDYHVFVLKEASFGSEWMRDVDTWSEAAMYQLLTALNPLFALWSHSEQRNFVDFVGILKGAMQGTDVLDVISAHVKRVQEANPGATIILTGHGTHGGWAKMLGQLLGNEHAVVALGPPGTRWTSKRYDATDELTANQVSLMPRKAALTMLDRHAGFIQETDCDSDNSMLGCQNVKNIVCDLLRSCGDEDGRFFTGFPVNSDQEIKCQY